MTTISGCVKWCQFCGSRKAGLDNPGADRRLRLGSIRFDDHVRRITQRSAGKLASVKNKKLAKNDLPKNARRFLPIGKLANGTQLKPWLSRHFWKKGILRFMFCLYILRFRLNYMTSNQIKRTISFSQICTGINFTASCYTSYCTYTVSVLCSLLLQ